LSNGRITWSCPGNWSGRQVRERTRFLFIAMLVLSSGCRDDSGDLDLSMYEYRDTRNLVRFVHEAAVRIQSDEDGLQAVMSDRSRYLTRDFYLYIYQTDGLNVFNAGMEYLEGRYLGSILDVDGKNIFQMIRQALADTSNSHSWVHYSWWEPGSFYPVPKSSCHFLVTTPQGRELIVGGGSDYPCEEREFARIIVDRAASLFISEGETAIDTIDDPVSSFNYRDVRVFAFRPDGAIVISPVLGDSLLQVDLLGAVDLAGNRPFHLALAGMADSDRAWQIFLDRSRFQREPVKKVLYLRRSVNGSDTVFFGAITDLPMPP